jgi:twitching motility protein PilJ
MTETNQLSQENLERNQKTYQAVLNSESAVNSGVMSVNTMNHGIISLNTETDQIVKRLEILEDFVQIAAAVSREQKKVAAKIKVLGLNASMIAERAELEKDPRQFNVIAQEFDIIASQINDVASITGESLLTLQQRTDRMQTVVSGFNQDIQSINELTFEFTETVNQTSDVFSQINMEIQQLTQYEQQLNEYSMAIAKASQTTLNAVEEITTLTKETENQSVITLEKSNMMGKSAYKLMEIIKFFKIN